MSDNIPASCAVVMKSESLNFLEPSGPLQAFNLLTPNVNYSGRTATLTSKVAFYIFIQQI